MVNTLRGCAWTLRGCAVIDLTALLSIWARWRIYVIDSSSIDNVGKPGHGQWRIGRGLQLRPSSTSSTWQVDREHDVLQRGV